MPHVPKETKVYSLCAVAGCGEWAYTRGWCDKHYQRWRIHGDPLTYKALKSKIVRCDIEGCHYRERRSGACYHHYREWWIQNTDATPKPPKPERAPSICSVKGCERYVTSRGWCSAHYGRWRLTGNPLTGGKLKPQKTRVERKLCRVGDCIKAARTAGGYCTDHRDMIDQVCSVTFCYDLILANGMCAAHYGRWDGSTEPHEQTPHKAVRNTPPCSVEGCEKSSADRGLCNTHYSRWQRYGNPLITRR